MNARMVWRRLNALLRRKRVEAQLDDELAFHLEMQVRKHRDAGMNADDAMRLARLEFGNRELVKEDARDVRGVRPIEELTYDVRYALRGLRRAPVFALAVILTIGLGVGINTSVFTIFDAYVLRPFAVKNPHSLYSVQWLDRTGHVRDFTPDATNALRRTTDIFSDVVAYRTFSVRLGGSAATGDAVSENFFTMAGVRPALGRLFAAADRATPVVVLSNAAWRTTFGADSSIVGKRILMRGYPLRVIGVAQPDFEGFFKKPRDFWIPFDMLATISPAAQSTPPSPEQFSLLARLVPGVSEARASAFVAATLQASATDLADSSRVARVFLLSRATAIQSSVRSYLSFAPLAVAFGLILLLACANVANMLLARGLARQREVGTRLALGASRGRLIRQLVTESLVLALPAVGVGFVLSWFAVDVGVRALFATLPHDLAAFVRIVPLHPDARVVVFALVASLGSAFAFGLMPALQATRLSIADATRGNFRSQVSPSRLRGGLVVGQIAVASLLLIVAGILLRETACMGGTDTGLRTKDVVSIEIQDKSRAAVLAALASERSVDTLAASMALPLDMRFPVASLSTSDGAATVDAIYNRVSASYFPVLGIGVTAGRAFTRAEEQDTAGVAVVSEAAVRLMWPASSPIGRTVRVRRAAANGVLAKQYETFTIVGVARDVVVQSVEDGKDRPVLYIPAALETPGCCLLARVRGDADAAKRTIDTNLDHVVPGGVDRMDRLETFVAGAVYPYRAAYWVSLTLGLIALGLTVTGVYGVVSYVVGQREREIGVRIALGATTIDVLRLILRQSFRQALIGSGIGAALAVIVARVLASTIQSMPAFDAIAFGGALGCVLAACMWAALIPSWRAARLDPTVALRTA